MTHRQHSRQLSPLTLDDLAGHLPVTHVDGARAASEAFRRQGIHHVLVGGLAVGLCGYPRSTRDIDFLVGEEAFEHHGPIVTHKPGLPVSYMGVGIDWISLEPSEQSALSPYLVLPETGEVPAMPASPLVAMKLLAGRQKDQADVVELIKAGIDTEDARRFLARHFPGKLDLFDRLARQAEKEQS